MKLRKVPIDKVRCQERPFSAILGFSGKTIDYFPPHTFYFLYMNSPDESRQRFRQWYGYIWFCLKGWGIEKKKGGMQDGSLARLVVDLHQKAGVTLQSLEQAREDIVWQSIDLRVDYYLGLFDSIRTKRFNKNFEPAIRCKYQDGLYYLEGGHHRVSALHVLGHRKIYVIVAQGGPNGQ